MEELYQISVEMEKKETKHALKYLEFMIASVRARGGKIIKIWHGSDKNESRGGIKEQVRADIKRLKKQGRVKFYIFGEKFCEEDETTRYMIEKYPFAKEMDRDWGSLSDAYVMVCI